MSDCTYVECLNQLLNSNSPNEGVENERDGEEGEGEDDDDADDASEVDFNCFRVGMIKPISICSSSCDADFWESDSWRGEKRRGVCIE